jgi:nitrogen fixation/metabolism regulation signal transduction histidine kinase
LRQAFEPYVTTRRDHGGTGLGLAIARRIVLEHRRLDHAAENAARRRAPVITIRTSEPIIRACRPS